MRNTKTEPTTHRILTGACALSAFFICLLAPAAAQTTSTTEKIPQGATIVTTAKFSGVVKYAEGNTLVVRMSTGNMRSFNVPDSLKFMIDGAALTVHDLKPGTSLSAKVITTTTPVTARTTTTLTGTVWYVAPPNVILTLADGTNKMYKSKPNYKFDLNGMKVTVFDLKKGMKITAEQIVEEPSSEIAKDATVTGHAPKSRS
jgi:hypothetical protein